MQKDSDWEQLKGNVLTRIEGLQISILEATCECSKHIKSNITILYLALASMAPFLTGSSMHDPTGPSIHAPTGPLNPTSPSTCHPTCLLSPTHSLTCNPTDLLNPTCSSTPNHSGLSKPTCPSTHQPTSP